MIPIYILDHNFGTHMCIESNEDVSTNSILNDAIHCMITILRQHVLEPLDDVTRTNIANRGQAYLNERVVSRIIAAGKVVCDISNNTEVMLERNQVVVTMWIARTCGTKYWLSFSNQPLGDLNKNHITSNLPKDE